MMACVQPLPQPLGGEVTATTPWEDFLNGGFADFDGEPKDFDSLSLAELEEFGLLEPDGESPCCGQGVQPNPTAAKAPPDVSDVGESPPKKQRLEAGPPSFLQGVIDWYLRAKAGYEGYCESGTSPSASKFRQFQVEPVFDKDQPRLVGAFKISIAAGSKDPDSGQRAQIPHLLLPMELRLMSRKKNPSPLKQKYSTFFTKAYIAARPFKKDEPIGFLCHEEQIEGETEDQWHTRLEKEVREAPRPTWIRVAEFDTSDANSEEPGSKVVRVIARKQKYPRFCNGQKVQKHNGMVMQYMSHVASDEDANCVVKTNGCIFSSTNIEEGEELKCAF